MTAAYTFVVTAEPGADAFGASHIREEIAEVLAANGWRLVPCNWAPDPDTISDATGGRDIQVVDLN